MTPPQEDRYCPRCGLATFASLCPRDGTSTLARTAIDLNAIAFRPGDVIAGRYRIIKLMGRGGYGAVFAAEHTGTGQPCAVKMLASDPGGLGDENQRRFFREAAITARLRHPNTVRVYDFGQAENGALFMAMELIEGPTLAQKQRGFVERGKALPEPEAIDMAIAVLRALGEAHTAELVHRDLKPANIMYASVPGEDPVVKVLDFGIVRARDSSLTASGTALGTPEYMSPEQCSGEPMDGRSDLYTLGVILYECVTGRLPFIDENPLRVMMMQMSSAAPDVRVFARTPLTDGFVDILATAMTKNPNERFADAKTMRLALEAARPASVAKLAVRPASEAVVRVEWAPTMVANTSELQASALRERSASGGQMATGQGQAIRSGSQVAVAPGSRTAAQAAAVTHPHKTAQRVTLSQLTQSPKVRIGVVAGTVALALLGIFAGGYLLAQRDARTPAKVDPAPEAEAVEAVPEPQARFVAAPSGETVADSKLHVSWQRRPRGDAMAFTQASAYCEKLILGGRGWRLPTKAELVSLANDLDPVAFGGAVEGWFWSSSPFQNSATTYWGVDFANARPNDYGVETMGQVRCVR